MKSHQFASSRGVFSSSATLLAILLVAACVQTPAPDLTTARFQESPSSSRDACRADARALCSSEVRSRDRAAVTACLEENRSKVSAACIEASQARSPMKQTNGVEYSYVDGEWDPLRTLRFQPASCGPSAPLVVFIHGGSWSRGDKDSGPGTKAAFFASNGFAFATVNYRLVPGVAVNESAQDIADAIGWLVANASTLGFDPDNVVLQGHSAGAHLAALVALDDRYLQSAGVDPAIIRVASLLDGAGYDITRQAQTGANADLYLQVFGDDPAYWKELSPITYVAASTANTDFVIHHMDGRRDSKDQAEALRDAIVETGRDAEVYAGINKTHKSLNQEFGLPGDVPTEQVVSFLASRVKACEAASAKDSAVAQFNPAQAALDRDSSGSLSPDEVPEMHKRFFGDADIDASGDLTPAEFQGLLGSLLPPREAEEPSRNQAPLLEARKGALSWSDVDAYLDQATNALPLEGANLIVLKGGAVVHQKNSGLYDENTEIPIASSTKWLTAALILTLVDDGQLNLDEPISSYLDWATGTKGEATLREILSHTGGFGPGHLAEQPRTWTLEQSARDAFAKPAIAPPGQQFQYGGIGMQIAAYIAEDVAGKPFAQLLDERLAQPLGMTRTYIGSGRQREVRAAISNPVAAAGGYSTAADYARFLEMLAGSGEFRGDRILSQSSIEEMFRDYTDRSAVLGQRTSIGEQRGYGLGAWCGEIAVDGRCLQMQSGGAFGTSPVVSINDQVAVLLMTKDRMPLIREHWGEISQAIRQLLLATP
jgi:CubicO group peptidase (beta-lactamase class C family)/acetyl esterase/lipase